MFWARGRSLREDTPTLRKATSVLLRVILPRPQQHPRPECLLGLASTRGFGFPRRLGEGGGVVTDEEGCALALLQPMARESQLEVSQLAGGADGGVVVEAEVDWSLPPLQPELVALALGRNEHRHVALLHVEQLVGGRVGCLDATDAPAQVVAREAAWAERDAIADGDLRLAKAGLRHGRPQRSRRLITQSAAGDGGGVDHALDDGVGEWRHKRCNAPRRQ